MRLFSIKPALTLSGRRFKGIRGWSGKPTHPPLTDFPIVCYVLVAAFDLISFLAADRSETGRDFYRAGTFVIVAGLFVSLGAALTGFWDWWKGMERERSSGPIGRAKHTQVWRTANWHMAIMLTVTAIVVIDVAIRVTNFEGAAGATVLVLSLLAGGLVALGAAYGGAMVFDYQFNVESLKGSTVWDETETDQLPGQRSQSGA